MDNRLMEFEFSIWGNGSKTDSEKLIATFVYVPKPKSSFNTSAFLFWEQKFQIK